jgi:hypothetical protein
MRGRLQRQRQHLGVRRRRVAPAEGLDARLEEFRAAVGALPEHRAHETVADRVPGLRRGEVVARHRNGQVGPQAELAALGVGGEEHAPADVLAGEVEERLGRLQDGGRGAHVARALVGRHERFRARVRAHAGRRFAHPCRRPQVVFRRAM